MIAQRQHAPVASASTSFSPLTRPVLQRKCACGGTPGSSGECVECREKRLSTQHSADDAAGKAPPIVHDVLRSPGQPLNAATRDLMEPRFGHDFSQVRVHTDPQAAESAQAVSARAYTVGRNIVFAEGQYHPRAEEGRKLLAHELTHTIQQSAFSSAAIPPHQPISIEPPGTTLEQAAEERSTRLTNSSRALAPIHRIALQRQPAPPPKTEKAEESGGEPLFTIFVEDESKRRDKQFARRQAQADAARIRKSGTLSTEDRQLVNARLRFFEGEAWEVYRQEIKPALVEVTREELQTPGQYVGHVDTPDVVLDAIVNIIAGSPVSGPTGETVTDPLYHTQNRRSIVKREYADLLWEWYRIKNQWETVTSQRNPNMRIGLTGSVALARISQAVAETAPILEKLKVSGGAEANRSIELYEHGVNALRRRSISEEAAENMRKLREEQLNPPYAIDPKAYNYLELYYAARDDVSGEHVYATGVYQVGFYQLAPHFRTGTGAIVYYVAYNPNKRRKEYLIGPRQLKQFLEHEDLYRYNAAAAYPMEGELLEYKAQSGRAVSKMMQGEIGASVEALGQSWKEALKDPLFYIEAGISTAGALAARAPVRPPSPFVSEAASGPKPIPVPGATVEPPLGTAGKPAPAAAVKPAPAPEPARPPAQTMKASPPPPPQKPGAPKAVTDVDVVKANVNSPSSVKPQAPGAHRIDWQARRGSGPAPAAYRDSEGNIHISTDHPLLGQANKGAGIPPVKGGSQTPPAKVTPPAQTSTPPTPAKSSGDVGLADTGKAPAADPMAKTPAAAPPPKDPVVAKDAPTGGANVQSQRPQAPRGQIDPPQPVSREVVQNMRNRPRAPTDPKNKGRGSNVNYTIDHEAHENAWRRLGGHGDDSPPAFIYDNQVYLDPTRWRD